MATEIERKFRVVGEAWRAAAERADAMEQGYLCGDGPASVRVRIDGEAANLNIKAAKIGMARAEYEYAIDIAEAREMLAELCVSTPVVKTRYRVPHGDHVWEIDEFGGANAPLVVAEIELDSTDEDFERPDWLGEEVTEERRYYNHALSFHPYSEWERE